jgi:hypothetical protein
MQGCVDGLLLHEQLAVAGDSSHELIGSRLLPGVLQLPSEPLLLVLRYTPAWRP